MSEYMNALTIFVWIMWGTLFTVNVVDRTAAACVERVSQ